LLPSSRFGIAAPNGRIGAGQSAPRDGELGGASFRYSTVGNGLYMLDVNFRSSTILGLSVLEGIGFLLQQQRPVLAS
jgi:hypothetical protein